MWAKIKENKFDYFLLSIIVMLVTSPLSPSYGSMESFPLASCLYAFATVLILGMLIESRRNFIIFSVFYVGLCAIDIVLYYTRCSFKEAFDVASTFLYSIVLIFLLVRLLFFLFRVKEVLSEHIKAGIAIYFLMGILWGFLYKILFYLDPNCFAFNTPGDKNLFYFSYVTLATLGYGDIIPTGSFTQMLAVMEAMLGQVFIAVFISRLMGFRIAHELMAKEKK